VDHAEPRQRRVRGVEQAAARGDADGYSAGPQHAGARRARCTCAVARMRACGACDILLVGSDAPAACSPGAVARGCGPVSRMSAAEPSLCYLVDAHAGVLAAARTPAADAHLAAGTTSHSLIAAAAALLRTPRSASLTDCGPHVRLQVVKELLADAKRLHDDAQRERTRVYTADADGYWAAAGARPSRPVSSVVLPDGVAGALEADAEEFLASEGWYTAHGVPYRRGYLLYGPPGTGAHHWPLLPCTTCHLRGVMHGARRAVSVGCLLILLPLVVRSTGMLLQLAVTRPHVV
jgi:BCS1 N terminal